MTSTHPNPTRLQKALPSINTVFMAKLFILLFGLSESAQAQLFFHSPPKSEVKFRCPNHQMLDKFLGFGDLFLGEAHGTSETPEFVKCLVNRAIMFSSEKIIVSLEMPSSAREPTADFWKKDKIEDGRSSKAMFELVKFLLNKENKALLNIHFQHHTRFFQKPEEVSDFQNNRAQRIGEELKALSQQGQVIALAGNVHSMKFLPDGFDLDNNLKTEGMYVATQFTHINLLSAKSGESWSCMPDCRVQEYKKPFGIDHVPGTLLNGASHGHDYIYYLDIDGFTASEPSDF